MNCQEWESITDQELFETRPILENTAYTHEENEKRAEPVETKYRNLKVQHMRQCSNPKCQARLGLWAKHPKLKQYLEAAN